MKRLMAAPQHGRDDRDTGGVWWAVLGRLFGDVSGGGRRGRMRRAKGNTDERRIDTDFHGWEYAHGLRGVVWGWGGDAVEGRIGCHLKCHSVRPACEKSAPAEISHRCIATH